MTPKIENQTLANNYLFQLLPDWAPTASSHVIRIDALFKVPQGRVINWPSAMILKLLDASQNIIGVKEEVLQTQVENLYGPAWLKVSSRLINLKNEVRYIEGVFD